MGKANIREFRVNTLIVVSAFTGACGPLDEPPKKNVENVGSVGQEAIRDPLKQHVTNTLDLDAGVPLTLSSKTLPFDTRRDVFEDENPAIGQDPDLWDQKKAGSDHQIVHGTRPVRRYGFQWLRSYARNSTVAFFDVASLKNLGDGKTRPLKLKESTNPGHQAELEIAQSGQDLCETERFAEQVRGGNAGISECTGTLIDKNLILTAAHCIRNTRPGFAFEGNNNFKPRFRITAEGQACTSDAQCPVTNRCNITENICEDDPGNGIDADGGLSNVRVAFNYVISKPGEEIVFETSRDLFRVREVLSINANIADLAILQLIDAQGDPIEALDPAYVPVPLWESDEPPPEAASKQFRQAAAIGTGHRLPQKISMSRSFGWLTDQNFLGINFYGDVFSGNSGGGMYDVETGALVGVVNNHQTPVLNVRCPNPISNQPNAWPLCKAQAGGVAKAKLPWHLFPLFDFTDADNPVFQGCSHWAPNDLTSSERKAYENLVEETYDIDNSDLDGDGKSDGAEVDIPTGGGTKGTIVTSVKALRELACDPANSGQPLLQAFEAKATALLSTRAEGLVGCSYPTMQDQILANDSDIACPTLLAIPDDEMPPGTKGPASVTFNESEAAAILRGSTLCTGTVEQPQAALWSELPQIHLEHGRETTLRGTTLNGQDYFANEDIDLGASFNIDALYSIDVDEWTILYADTFSGGKDLGSTLNPGTNFDTVFFFMEANVNDDDPLLVNSAWTKLGDAFDDSGCNGAESDVDFYFQSQMTQALDPNKKYILGVTGYGGDSGNFNLHIQSAPGVRFGRVLGHEQADDTFERDGITFDEFRAGPFAFPNQSEQACVDQDGAFEEDCVYNVQPKSRCEVQEVFDEIEGPTRGSGEYGLVTVSCPLAKQKRFEFEAQRLLGLGEESDPVAVVWEGQRQRTEEGYVCSDDSKFNFVIPDVIQVDIHSLNSDIGHPEDVHADNVQMVLTSGAGLRVFYVNQYQPLMNWQDLAYKLTLPIDATNDIWGLTD